MPILKISLLEELTKLDISENGYHSKVSSFDDYLNKANELHQKLLIEIKTSRKDSPDMMKRFMEKYGTVLKQNGHQMQSLDYHVIDQVLAYDSQIPVYFILPYNSIFPSHPLSCRLHPNEQIYQRTLNY